MKIQFDNLIKFIESASYSKNGESNERLHGAILAQAFPNSEKFWKYFIVPLTNRLDTTITNPHIAIQTRPGTSTDLHDIGSFHYSLFYNFLLAQLSLTTKHPSYFESFYTHLGSICDSAEELLIKIYLLIHECSNTHSDILEKLSKVDFLVIAGKWYDENYQNVYDHYLSIGKPPPMKLPMRSSVLEEYFGRLPAWKNYKRLSQKIKEYRNVIVHNYQIAFIQFPNGISYVPKKENIKKYKKWNEVFIGANDPNVFQRDFVNREEQMTQDIFDMMTALNGLWEKPIEDMTLLMFTEKNQILLSKYDISFT